MAVLQLRRAARECGEVTKPLPAQFNWRQFEPQVILNGCGWYLRFSLSHRDVEELVR
jgi:transposase-like protein